MSMRSGRSSPDVCPEDVKVKKDAEKDDSRCDCHCGFLGTVSSAITGALESAFYHIGSGVARRPWLVMLCCVIATGAFIPGMALFFYTEDAIEKLFVPDNSQAIEDKAFVQSYFPIDDRFELMLVEAPNVLTPAVITAMLDIDIQVKAIEDPGVYSWYTLCARLGPECWSNSLLELWSFNETTIRALTQAEILYEVNTATISPVYNSPFSVDAMLGDITKDTLGNITGAKLAHMSWTLVENTSDTSPEAIANLEGFEKSFLEIGEAGHPDTSHVYYYSGRSFGDLFGGTLSEDLVLLAGGYIIVSAFVIIVLGRFSHIHHRIWITVGAVVSVGLALVVSFGFCSYIGLFFTTVHTTLPFLFVGIGIDDAFVICHALDSLGALSEPTKSGDKVLSDRMGQTLRHAGVSITVTSLTDILAFSVGATTTLPALRSFCAYAAVGIFAMYVFMATFLVACLTYDEARISQKRNACCCCYSHDDDYEPNPCTEKSTVQRVFERFYAPLIVKLPTKIVVVLLAAGMGAVGVWGVINLEQDFHFTWFFPDDSYAAAYWDTRDAYFPAGGVAANVYFDDSVDYYQDYDMLKTLHLDLMADQYIAPSTVDSWYYSFRDWTNTSTNPNVTALVGPDGNPSSETNYYTLLGWFVGSLGDRFEGDIIFTYNVPAKVEISRSSFRYVTIEGASEEIKAMDSTRELVREAVPKYDVNQIFAYSEDYLDYETNKAIQQELYRNLGLAFLCVLLMTLVLLANLLTCFYVCICVILTLVDVGACMHFWGLTIDTVTSINLIVAIGLAVDYSAHIAHTFMTQRGTRNDRTEKTLTLIGPAVLYGAFSTFLAFLLLSASKSYIFDVFFKVFFLVVLFGMFHGMVFLPVILSWIGPGPYRTSAPTSGDDSFTSDEHASTIKLDSYALSTNGSIIRYTEKDVKHDSFSKENHYESIEIATVARPLPQLKSQTGNASPVAAGSGNDKMQGVDNPALETDRENLDRDENSMTPVHL